MQKYGKTLYYDRFSPIFYNFAIKLTVRETNSLQKNTTNNSNNEILLTKRKATKKDGNMWEPTGGLVQSGENSMDGAKRELKEEIGISVDNNDLILLKTNTEKGNVNVFRDVYVINKDIQINDLEFIDSEVSDAKYVTFEEFKNMIDKGEAFKWLEWFYEEYCK